MSDQSPYTPSLDEVRLIAGDSLCTNPEDPSHERDICPGDLAFDRFIAQVRAEAWDEGWNAAVLNGRYGEEPNPYRKEQ